jgi:hypothetical protein
MSENHADIQNIKKRLSLLNSQRTQYIFSLVHGKSLIHGIPQSVYRKCGKKKCRCSKGHLHGPYSALSINKNGRQKIVMLKKAGDPGIQKKAKRYKHFQETLARIRKINREIDYLLNIIKLQTCEEYSDV